MAAAPDDAPVDQMESYLTCSICLETLQDPRTLPCFHSFCKCCLEKFVKRQREKAEPGKVIELFNCPDCRTEFEIREGQHVADMPRNYFIVNMLEVLAIQRRPNQIPCNSCKRKDPAVCWCMECKNYLCRECHTVHGKWPAFEKHTVFTMEELGKPENQDKTREKSTCKKHKNETFDYYCETCTELACIHCVLLDHKEAEGHSYLSTEEVAEKKRELLKSSSSFLNDQVKEGSNALKHIEHVLQELEKNAENAKDKINRQKVNILEAFTERQKNALKEFIEKQKSDLKEFTNKLEEKAKLNTNEVDNTYKQTHGLLGKQKAAMNIYVEKVKSSAELSNNLLEKGTREEILSFQNEIEENVKEVKNQRPTQMKPVHDGSVEYIANPVINIDTIINVGNIGVVVDLNAVDPHNLRNTSTILHGHIEYVKQVVGWLGDQFQWRLCYRASTHGWSGQNFHTNCDNKGPTVTLVKVGEYILGGYTDQNWQGQGYKQSNVSFLFSLKNKDNVPPFKAPVYQNHQKAIYSDPRHGPRFGRGHDLYISNNSHANQNSFTNFGVTYQPPAGYVYDTPQTRSLLAGSFNFTPNEIEVFFKITPLTTGSIQTTQRNKIEKK